MIKKYNNKIDFNKIQLFPTIPFFVTDDGSFKRIMNLKQLGHNKFYKPTLVLK